MPNFLHCAALINGEVYATLSMYVHAYFSKHPSPRCKLPRLLKEQLFYSILHRNLENTLSLSLILLKPYLKCAIFVNSEENFLKKILQMLKI